MLKTFKPNRSPVISKIRSRGNRDTEIALAKLFRLNRITGWRRNQPVYGKPDFVFRQLKIAVFVDGCFWHACPRHSNIPANNRPFWKRKLESNQRRDSLVGRELRAKGWRVIRIWEHELSRKNLPRLTRKIQRALMGP